MNRITDWHTGQLDASQEYILQAYNKLYDFFSLILVYANVNFETARSQLLAEAEVMESVIDPAIRDLEDLREFLDDVGVRDDSIIDVIEDMYERGGQIRDTSMDKIEHATPPSEAPCADICDCDVGCDFNVCSDNVDNCDSSDDNFCDCDVPLCVTGMTDEDRADTADRVLDNILPDCFTEADKSAVVDNAQEQAKANEEAARAQQELQDKADQLQDKADQLQDLADQRAQEAKDSAQNAKDVMDQLLEQVQPGDVFDKSGVGSIFGALGAWGSDRFADDRNEQLDWARQEGLQAAHDVLQNGGTLEDAKNAYDQTLQENFDYWDRGTEDSWVGGLVSGLYDAMTSKDEGRYEDVTNADKGLIEDAFNAWQQAQEDQTLADIAQSAANAAQNAANQAQQAADNAAPPCHTCDCYNPTTGCPDAYTGPECNTCDGCYDSAGGCAGDCFGNSDTPCDFSCDCADSACDGCGDCDCDGCGDCDCDSSCYCDCYSCGDCDSSCDCDSGCSADGCAGDCFGCDYCICDGCDGDCWSCFSE